MCGCLWVESTFFFEQGVDLAFGTELKNQIEVVVVLVMVVQLENVIMIKLIHNLYFKFDLLNQVMLENLFLVDNLDGKHVFGDFMSYFVYFSKATYTDIGVGK